MSALKISVAVVALLGAVSAQAFTYDSRTNQDPSGQAKLRAAANAMANGGKIGNSHFSMQFSGGPSGYGQGGIENRFVPSANPAFANPYYSPNNLDMALGNHH
jgi:hypothetical protein